jgi:hypothetical protein
MDPRPGVLHAHPRAPARAGDDDADTPAARRELGAVLEHVPEDLGHARRVRGDAERSGPVPPRPRHLERDPALDEHRPVILDRPLDELREVEDAALELDLATGDAGRVEEVVDDAREVPHLPPDDRPRPRGLLAPRRGMIEDVERVGDGGERVPQLVGEDREELVLAPVRLPERLLVASVGERALRELRHEPREGHVVRDDVLDRRAAEHRDAIERREVLPLVEPELPRQPDEEGAVRGLALVEELAEEERRDVAALDEDRHADVAQAVPARVLARPIRHAHRPRR